MSANIVKKLKAAKQARILKALDSLEGASKAKLLAQLEQIDWDELPSLIEN